MVCVSDSGLSAPLDANDCQPLLKLSISSKLEVLMQRPAGECGRVERGDGGGAGGGAGAAAGACRSVTVVISSVEGSAWRAVVGSIYTCVKQRALAHLVLTCSQRY